MRQKTGAILLVFLQLVLEGLSLYTERGSSHYELGLSNEIIPHPGLTLFEDPLMNSVWCDPVLGCLQTNGSWYGPTRPINAFPDSRKEVNTKFYLNTRSQSNVDEDYIVSADNLTSLSSSSFNVSKPTKFIVHGFIDSGDRKWVKELVCALLEHGDYNVIRVDWKDGAKPMYYQATANTRVVGLEISHFVSKLMTEEGLDPGTVHCIGHSLGSHICGYGGENVPGMGRITGLDPAGPYFTGTPYFVHLDPSDASFVDVIHTDGKPIILFGFGTAEPMGNLDFYPNSGKDQPGCDPVDIIDDIFSVTAIDSVYDIFACQHMRAIKYFTESLMESSCTWLAHECSDYDSFEEGKCYSCSEDGTKCAYMGINANKYPAKDRQFVHMYLDTDKNYPYCMNHYVVTILTAHPKEASLWVMGKLYLSLYGTDGTVIDHVQITEDNEKIYHGTTNRFLFIDHSLIYDVDRMELKWEYNAKLLDPPSYCLGILCNKNLYVQTVEVSPINVYPESDRLASSTLGCKPNGGMTKIKDKHTKSFPANANCQKIPNP